MRIRVDENVFKVVNRYWRDSEVDSIMSVGECCYERGYKKYFVRSYSVCCSCCNCNSEADSVEEAIRKLLSSPGGCGEGRHIPYLFSYISDVKPYEDEAESLKVGLEACRAMCKRCGKQGAFKPTAPEAVESLQTCKDGCGCGRHYPFVPGVFN